MLEIKGIKKHFGTVTAVDNLNLSIEKGENFALLGRNGAGKSTSIKMIVGLMIPDEGTISFDGIDIHKDSINAKKKFAYIPDIPYLYDKMTGMEFLHFIGNMYGIDKEIIKEKSMNLAKLFDLEDRIHQRTEEYSHGMRQKLIFGSAFLINPEYIILDEPMVGLDPQSQRIVKHVLFDLAKKHNVGILMSTHELGIATQIADRVGIIHHGRLEKVIKNENIGLNELEQLFIDITGDYAGDYKDRIRK